MGHFQFVYVDRRPRKEETEPKMFNDCTRYVRPYLNLGNISKQNTKFIWSISKVTPNENIQVFQTWKEGLRWFLFCFITLLMYEIL